MLSKGFFHCVTVSTARNFMVYELMGVFCDRLKFGSTAAIGCRTDQNKGRYHKKELLFLLVLLNVPLGKTEYFHNFLRHLWHILWSKVHWKNKQPTSSKNRKHLKLSVSFLFLFQFSRKKQKQNNGHQILRSQCTVADLIRERYTY